MHKNLSGHTAIDRQLRGEKESDLLFIVGTHAWQYEDRD